MTPTTGRGEELRHQRARGRCRPAGGEHVVDDEHPVVGGERVAVHLQHVAAVLQLVAVRVGVPRQLARLAHRHEPGAQGEGDRRREDEPARLDTDHLGDRPVRVGPVERRDEQVGGEPERIRVAEQRRDVAEHDARLGEVGDVADEGQEVAGGGHAVNLRGRGQSPAAVVAASAPRNECADGARDVPAAANRG